MLSLGFAEGIFASKTDFSRRFFEIEK